jgi:ureidoglycolate hydrolase
MTKLVAQDITEASFLDYGQPIVPVGDLTPYSDHDAKLYFDAGSIRFYVMQLEHPDESVVAMTRHTHCSQCLGSADAEPWWIAVAAPDLSSEAIDSSTLKLFRIEPRQAIKLHPGTWHAGPYFKSKTAAFYNLELSNTKIADHMTRKLNATINLQLD